MSWSEFFGFLISMFFMLFVLLRPGWEARRKKNNPEQYAKEQQNREQRMQTFLKQNHIILEKDLIDGQENILEEDDEAERQKEKERRAIEQSRKKLKHQQQQIKKQQQQTQASSRPATIAKIMEKTYGEEVISHLKSSRELFIIQAIIDRPKGLN